jgi:hypothetical protein
MSDTSDATFGPQSGFCGPGTAVTALGVARMGKLKSRALVACELLGTRFLRSYVGLAFYAERSVSVRDGLRLRVHAVWNV